MFLLAENFSAILLGLIPSAIWDLFKVGVFAPCLLLYLFLYSSRAHSSTGMQYNLFLYSSRAHSSTAFKRLTVSSTKGIGHHKHTVFLLDTRRAQLPAPHSTNTHISSNL